MPKSKSHKVQKSRPGKGSGKGSGKGTGRATGKSSGKAARYGSNLGKPSSATNRKAMLLVALVVVAGVAYWWQSSQTKTQAVDEFSALVAAGQPALARVRSPASQGNGHLAPGQTKNYVEPFPTSGDHAAQGIRNGFYDTEQPKTGLVHSMEHGNVVIYYDTPGQDAIATLKDWAGRFDGPWSGLVVTRSPGLGQALVLTAWTKSLRLNSFDAAEAAAFVDAYRGRGPENPVR